MSLHESTQHLFDPSDNNQTIAEGGWIDLSDSLVPEGYGLLRDTEEKCISCPACGVPSSIPYFGKDPPECLLFRADYIKYLFKTVRKFFGEAIVVTQEVDDIIKSPIVKESIINNSDCKILLDQRKYMNKFDDIQAMLGLTDKEKAQVLSINMDNSATRLYKEVWIGLGGSHSAVYATEVSLEEYLAYTTEEIEKMEVMQAAAELDGNVELAIKKIAMLRREKEK